MLRKWISRKIDNQPSLTGSWWNSQALKKTSISAGLRMKQFISGEDEKRFISQIKRI